VAIGFDGRCGAQTQTTGARREMYRQTDCHTQRYGSRTVGCMV